MLRHPAGLWIFLVVPKHRHLECLFVVFSEGTVIEPARGDPRALPASSLPGQQNGQPASLKASWPLLFLAFQLFQTREEVRPQQIQPLAFGPLLAALQGRGCDIEILQEAALHGAHSVSGPHGANHDSLVHHCLFPVREVLRGCPRPELLSAGPL